MIDIGHGLDALEAWRDSHDAAVAASPDLDAFCSRGDWVLSFARSHAPTLPVRVARRAQAHVTLTCSAHPDLGTVWHALEHAWRFASPIAGEGGEDLLLDWIAADGGASRAHAVDASLPPLHGTALLLSGLDAGPRLQRLLTGLHARHELYRLPSTGRAVASLQGGLDGYLSRRSAGLRRNLQRAQRRAQQAGLRIERVHPAAGDDVAALYRRVLDVEQRSWKSQQGMGADSEPMRSFYALMLPRLARDGRARVLLARLGERDVGYMHGGEVGTHFRSLQFSYDEAHARLAIGNLMHLELLRWLCEDALQSYDLGQLVDYKRRWSDGVRATPNILAVPR